MGKAAHLRDFLAAGGVFGSCALPEERTSALAQPAFGSMSMSSALTNSVSGTARMAPRPPSSQAQNSDRNVMVVDSPTASPMKPGLDQRLDHQVQHAVDDDDGQHQPGAAGQQPEQRGRDDTEDEAHVRDEVRDERQDAPR